MDCSMPGFPVLHHLLESALIRVHWVWCHPTILSSVVPFSSCPQSFPASGSFPVSWLFSSGGQSIGGSALAWVLPVNIQGWFPLGLTGLISLPSGDSEESSPAPEFESFNSSALSLLYGSTLTSYRTTGKTIDLTRRTFVSKGMSLRFNTLSGFAITLLPIFSNRYLSILETFYMPLFLMINIANWKLIVTIVKYWFPLFLFVQTYVIISRLAWWQCCSHICLLNWQSLKLRQLQLYWDHLWQGWQSIWANLLFILNIRS